MYDNSDDESNNASKNALPVITTAAPIPHARAESAYEQIVFARTMRHRFRVDIYNKWLVHGNLTLDRLATTNPEAFAKLYLASLPKEAVLKVEDNRKKDSDEKAVKIMSLLDQLKTIRESRAALDECISDSEVEADAEYATNPIAGKSKGGLKVIQLERTDTDNKFKK